MDWRAEQQAFLVEQVVDTPSAADTDDHDNEHRALQRTGRLGLVRSYRPATRAARDALRRLRPAPSVGGWMGERTGGAWQGRHGRTRCSTPVVIDLAGLRPSADSMTIARCVFRGARSRDAASYLRTS